MKPKSIDRYLENGNLTDIASFDYYTGIKYCNDHAIPQITDIDKEGNGPTKQMFLGRGFIVTCGDVCVSINTMFFPDIERTTTVMS